MNARTLQSWKYGGTLRDILGNLCALSIPRQIECEARGVTAEFSRQVCIPALICMNNVAKLSARPSIYRASAVPLVFSRGYAARGKLVREALWHGEKKTGKYLSATTIDRSILRRTSACHSIHHRPWLVMPVCRHVSFGRRHGAFPSLPGGVKSKDLQAHMLEPSSSAMQKERFGRWDMIVIQVVLEASPTAN